MQRGTSAEAYNAVKVDTVLDDSEFQINADDMTNIKVNASDQEMKIDVAVDASAQEDIVEFSDVPVNQIQSIDAKEALLDLVNVGVLNYNSSFIVDLKPSFEPSSVICAYYDKNGKMIDIESASVPSEIHTIKFAPKSMNYANIKLFFVDDNYTPLCDPYGIAISRD